MVGEKTRLVRNDWFGKMMQLQNNIEKHHYSQGHLQSSGSTAGTKDCDCFRQLCAEVCCGIFCLPCATTRLVGHCTGCLSPERITAIPGLECFSSACGSNATGYDHSNYIGGQIGGSGFSRRTLDVINVVVTPILCSAGGAFAVISLINSGYLVTASYLV